MELASMLAGEPFSDHPQSVCPVIGTFLRTYNDAIDDEGRQDLYEYASLAVGTTAPGSGMRETRASPRWHGRDHLIGMMRGPSGRKTLGVHPRSVRRRDPGGLRVGLVDA
jgi:hypothetical protein